MSGKQKLKRFRDNTRLKNVTEYTESETASELRGNWGSKIFKNDNPIVLELACGKGEYSVNLAKQFPGKNFIGVDIKGARIWVGAKQAENAGLANVHFLRAYIDHLDRFFATSEISEIWITFPDPYHSKSRKRLTSPKFLNLYRKIAGNDCVVHLKTDSGLLWQFTRETIQAEKLNVLDICEDVYAERADDPMLAIQTYFEKMHLADGKRIRYIAFSLNS